MKPVTVIDKQGNRVVRANGILQDGDHMRVIGIHDNKPNIDPRLEQAMRDAVDVRRLEQFDARHHRPGPFIADRMPAADRLNHINALTDAEKARDARTARMNAAWKAPPPIVDQEFEPRPPARTADEHPADARDRRTEAAWQRTIP
jgi:hypothetical protein